jgi:hypothetical protein
VFCGTGCGYVSAFRAATGEPLWFCYIGTRPRQLWSREDGTLVALTAAGDVFLLTSAGELLGHQELGAAVSALLRPGEHRMHARLLPVGTTDRVVWLLDG